MGKVILSFVVEKFPQHVHGKKWVFFVIRTTVRTVVIYKPLKAFDFITAIVFNKIKHASLVRIKSGGDMLEKQGCVGVDRKNAKHLLIFNFHSIAYCFS